MTFLLNSVARLLRRRIWSISFPLIASPPGGSRECKEVPTVNEMTTAFGPTGIADAGARLRVQGPASLRHPMGVFQTEPGLAGEQLR